MLDTRVNTSAKIKNGALYLNLTRIYFSTIVEFYGELQTYKVTSLHLAIFIFDASIEFQTYTKTPLSDYGVSTLNSRTAPFVLGLMEEMDGRQSGV